MPEIAFRSDAVPEQAFELRCIRVSAGGAAVMATLAGSASYIAVPAAMRVALPQANPALYLTLALGVTFPFNLVLGIPLWIAAATHLTRA